MKLLCRLILLANLSPVAICAAAAQAKLHKEGNQSNNGSHPHKGKHEDADVCADVELVLRRQGDACGNANHGSDNGRNGQQDARQAGYNDGDQAPPPREHHQRRSRQHHGVKDAAGHEERVHNLRSNPQELQDGDDFGGQRNLGASEQFVDENLDRVEPVELLIRGAVCDTSVESGLAIIGRGEEGEG